MQIATGEQEAPVFLDQGARAIRERAAMRFAAFLESELDEIPAWHPTAARYRQQLRRMSATQRALTLQAVPLVCLSSQILG